METNHPSSGHIQSLFGTVSSAGKGGRKRELLHKTSLLKKIKTKQTSSEATTLNQDILKWHIGKYKDNVLLSKPYGRVFNRKDRIGNSVEDSDRLSKAN